MWTLVLNSLSIRNTYVYLVSILSYMNCIRKYTSCNKYLLCKVNNRNTWKICKTFSKLNIKTLERHFIPTVNTRKLFSCVFRRCKILVSLFLTLNIIYTFLNVFIVDFKQVNVSGSFYFSIFSLDMEIYWPKKIFLHSFHSTDLFLYLLKTSGNLYNVHKISRKTNISYLLIRTRYWKKSCEESCIQFLCVGPNWY